jgi:hypothetical protein
LPFAGEEERARFFHNVAVFFGSPGPAADLARAREGFAVALKYFDEHDESGWHARTLHNFGTSLSNLGATFSDLAESVAHFERALAWRTTEREIARVVTLHNMGIALRRLARLARKAPPLISNEAPRPCRKRLTSAPGTASPKATPCRSFTSP